MIWAPDRRLRVFVSSTVGEVGELAAERQAAVTFLFSDIEGSTRLVQRLGDGYGAVREAYAAIVRRAIGEASGVEVSTEGDSFLWCSPARPASPSAPWRRPWAATTTRCAT